MTQRDEPVSSKKPPKHAIGVATGCTCPSQRPLKRARATSAALGQHVSRRFDAIVIGVGGMGSAAAYHLARRGLRVLGLDRFEIPNEQGSSHGITRAIRLAYAEDPAYVPLLPRAYEGWRELETEADKQLLHITGSMDISRPDQPIVQGAIRSCEEYGLPYELLEAAEVARRFPGYRLDPEMVALLQPDGGFILPERAIAAHARGALAAGAELRPGERVTGWEPTRKACVSAPRSRPTRPSGWSSPQAPGSAT